MILNANAVITAVDRFSGPVGRMAGALNALTRVSNRANAVATSARRAGSAMAGPMAMGLGAIIYGTQEFEKKALGLRIASIADSMDRFGNIDHGKIARDAEAIKASSLATSTMLGVSPTGLIEAAEAAAKMGIALKQADAIMRTSAILNMIDPDVGHGTAAELMGTLGLQFKAPTDADGYSKWIAATGDKIAMVASATRTSVSRIQDGLRQFSGVFATFGASIDETGALLGGMVQGGLMDEESGTALKSSALRFIKPTFEGTAAMTALGIDRRNYMDLTGSDPYRATNQLMRMFTGYIKKDNKAWILNELQKAQKEGRGADPEHIDRIAGYINNLTGDKETIEDTYLKVLNTITSAGGKVDIFKYLSDVAGMVKDGKISDAQLATIFEGRHIARMKTLFNQWGEVMRVLDISQRAQGQGLDAAKLEYQQSAYGRWESALSSLQRAAIRLRETDGINAVVTSLGNLANAVASMPSGAIEVIGKTAAAFVALSAVGWTLGGVAMGISAVAAALGAFAAIPSAPILAVSAALATLVTAMTGWESIANAAKVLSETFQTIGNAISSFMSSIGGVLEKLNLMPKIEKSGAATNTYDYGAYRHGVNPDGTPKGMIRDIDPNAGPQTVDVTGRVDANVQGTVQGRVDVEVTVKGGGEVTKKSGGDLKGSLQTGKSMSDAGR